MIFYFTGTSNSLYVAKQLGEHPISIAQAIHEKELTFEDETIGIVAPVYGHEMPAMVKDFIKRSTLKTGYFYLVLTYGNRHGGAAELAYNFCKECGILPSYINIIPDVTETDRTAHAQFLERMKKLPEDAWLFIENALF